MNPTAPLIHIGWRAIGRRLGVRDIRTIKNLIKNNHVPIYRIGKSPRLDESTYIRWTVEVINLSKKNDGGRHE